MTLMIDQSGSAQKEIRLELEHNPPPDFRSVGEALEWAEEHLPINTYIEVWSKNDSVRYTGHTHTAQRKG